MGRLVGKEPSVPRKTVLSGEACWGMTFGGYQVSLRILSS